VNLPLFIARRYFFSKKSQRAINIISMISVIGVLIGTAALVIVLSVFNGFENLIVKLYNSFDPDFKITLAEGKSFRVDELSAASLRKINGVAYVTSVLEENALVRFRDKQTIVTLKGVSEDFERMTGIDSMIVDGKFQLMNADTDFAVMGGAIAYNLQVQPGDYLHSAEIYAPRTAATSLLQPEEAFHRSFIPTSGIFAIQQEFDAKYILVSLRFAREVLETDSSLTAIEIGLSKGADPDKVRTELERFCGKKFLVQNRYELHASIYKIMKSEKWAVFLILTFILIIATFNVISSLTMLVIEKKKDIAILHSMGAGMRLLRRIFLLEGMFITVIGAAGGLILGLLICFLQEHYSLVRLSGSGSFVIDAYPVHLHAPDFLYVTLTVLFIGLLAAWYPAKNLVGKSLNLRAVAADE